MLKWINGLFSGFDRQQKAADRAATALEDIADGLEGVRDQLFARLGLEPSTPKSLAPVGESEKEPRKKGRDR